MPLSPLWSLQSPTLARCRKAKGISSPLPGRVCSWRPLHRIPLKRVTAVFECAGQSFTARGKTILCEGWKEIDRKYRAALKNKPETDDADSDTEKTLPPFTEGQTFENPTATVTEHDTTPPKPHNEASLLSAMERAGSEDTDPDTETQGLGTPATRAAVIEKLVKGGFVERKGKQLLPTKDGINLVCVLPDTLTSPQLTAEWENNLTQIAKGKADPAAFMEGIEDMARELVKTYPFLLMIKRRCSSRNGKRWEAAPAAVLLSMRERKTTIAATKNVFLPCGKMTVSLKNEK